MSTKRSAVDRAVDRIDEEFAADRGALASDDSLAKERHPGMHPQSPRQLGHKIAAEAGEGRGPVEKAKRVVEELDRDISGEYERREDATAKPERVVRPRSR